jgi:acyl-CoA reductase-like NAD-dependent aldehyde dehydrogenase
MSSIATAQAQRYKMFVNGDWVVSDSGKTFPVYDPSTEEVIAEVPDSNAKDVDRAVAAAKDAFENGPWGSSAAQERGRVLFKLADAVRQNAAPLAELEARNSRSSKPSTTWAMLPPALSTTADWRPRCLATLIPFLTTP